MPIDRLTALARKGKTKAIDSMTIKAQWIVLSLSCILFSCGSHDQRKGADPLSGRELSEQYCQSCHLYPEPALLDKNTWERSVLPLMGRRLGIYEENVPRSNILDGAIDKDLVTKLNIFPAQPLMDRATWQKISEYYISAAPERLPPISRADVKTAPLTQFEVIVPSYQSPTPLTTMVEVDSKNSTVYVGGSKGNTGALTILNANFEVTDRIRLPSAPVDIAINEDALTLTLVGALILSPTNNPKGQVLHIFRPPGETKYSLSSNFLEDLRRPLQTTFDDVNEDGRDDIIIADFGYYTGALNLYESSVTNKGAFKKSVLKNEAGAIRIHVHDMNRDGKKDVVVLFAQGDEGISIFYNEGNGQFNEERILRFSPAYGSVYFELADTNNDGHDDILFCNGDNGDYPPILKNYHGIRIFENDGNNKFRQVYFYPMNGAYKSSAADFDLDGDLDVIGISYFPDQSATPRQDLVYLENNGNYSFSAQTLDKNISGRWITFDVGDLDKDGYADVLLGAAGSIGNHRATQSPSLVWLKNAGEH